MERVEAAHRCGGPANVEKQRLAEPEHDGDW
jgi:hypothetical protein